MAEEVVDAAPEALLLYEGGEGPPGAERAAAAVMEASGRRWLVSGGGCRCAMAGDALGGGWEVGLPPLETAEEGPAPGDPHVLSEWLAGLQLEALPLPPDSSDGLQEEGERVRRRGSRLEGGGRRLGADDDLLSTTTDTHRANQPHHCIAVIPCTTTPLESRIGRKA
jgi:hypothetical protein